jgi:hypothetical protein
MLGQGRASFYSHSSNCPRPGIVRCLCCSKICLLDIISKRPELIKLLSNFLYVFGVVYFDASFFVSAGVVAVITCSIGKIGGNCNRESITSFAGVYLRMHAVAVLYAKVLLCVEDLFHSTEMGILTGEPANYAALTFEVPNSSDRSPMMKATARLIDLHLDNRSKRCFRISLVVARKIAAMCFVY